MLAYIAFALVPLTRTERVESHKGQIFLGYDFRQQDLLRFVLDHYVARGVGELDTAKMPQLIELKYHTMGDAVRELGAAGKIHEVFVGFQARLY